MMRYFKHIAVLGVAFMASAAIGQNAPMLKQDAPIEISSDKLDVLQNEHKAIFTGNVIAVQGSTNMRSAVMTVYYRESGANADAKAPAASSGAQGIYRIDAEQNVVFTTPTETAIGDRGVYDVDANTIDLTGGNVTLTRGQSILKGTHVTYNMTTGRSVLTSGNGAVAESGGATGGKPQRVHGLFVPKAETKDAAKP